MEAPFRGRVVYDFEYTNDGDLPLFAGEEIDVLSQDGDWFLGRKDNGEEGYFPTTYVEVAGSGEMYDAYQEEDAWDTSADYGSSSNQRVSGSAPLFRQEREEKTGNTPGKKSVVSPKDSAYISSFFMEKVFLAKWVKFVTPTGKTLERILVATLEHIAIVKSGLTGRSVEVQFELEDLKELAAPNTEQFWLAFKRSEMELEIISAPDSTEAINGVLEAYHALSASWPVERLAFLDIKRSGVTNQRTPLTNPSRSPADVARPVSPVEQAAIEKGVATAHEPILLSRWVKRVNLDVEKKSKRLLVVSLYHLTLFKQKKLEQQFSLLDIEMLTSVDGHEINITFRGGRQPLELQDPPDCYDVLNAILDAYTQITRGYSPEAAATFNLSSRAHPLSYPELPLIPGGGLAQTYHALCTCGNMKDYSPNVEDALTAALSDAFYSKELVVCDLPGKANHHARVVEALLFNTWYEVLTIDGGNPSVFQPLCRVINNGNIHTLVYPNSKAKSISDLGTSLLQLKNLTYVDMARTVLSDNDVKSGLGQGLISCPLKYLDLYKCLIGSSGIKFLFDSIAPEDGINGLVSLNIGGNSFGKSGTTAFVAWFSRCGKDSLQVLSIRKADLEMAIFGKGLSEAGSNQLTVLSVARNSMSKAALEPMRQVLSSPSLTCVDIEGVKGKDSQLQALAAAAVNNQKSSVVLNLSDLSSSKPRDVMSPLDGCNNLVGLILDDYTLGLKQLEAVLGVCSGCPNLRRFSLNGSLNVKKNQAEATRMIAEFLDRVQLEALSLNTNGKSQAALGPTATQVLDKLSSVHTSLVELCIEGNEVGDYGMDSVTFVIQNCTYLRTLMIDCNQISLQGLSVVVGALDASASVAYFPLPLKDIDVMRKQVKQMPNIEQEINALVATATSAMLRNACAEGPGAASWSVVGQPHQYIRFQNMTNFGYHGLPIEQNHYIYSQRPIVFSPGQRTRPSLTGKTQDAVAEGESGFVDQGGADYYPAGEEYAAPPRSAAPPPPNNDDYYEEYGDDYGNGGGYDDYQYADPGPPPPPPMAAAPPPPPPPPAPAAPPAPPPPPAPSSGGSKKKGGGGGGGGRGGLLNGIEGFKKGALKKTETNDRSAPKV